MLQISLNKRRIQYTDYRYKGAAYAAAALILALITLGYAACQQPDDDTIISYKVTFAANSGAPEPEVQIIVQGGKAVEPPTLTRSGYQFDGWYADSNCTPPSWDFNTDTVNTDLTLYAGWKTFYAVASITGVPTAAVQGLALTLTGTVSPQTATNKTIEWTVKSGSASISDRNRLTASAGGTVVVTATIINGSMPGTVYTQDFTISVWESEDPRIDFLGHWFGERGVSGNPGYFDTDITISADKFSHLDGWGYYLDIINLSWAAATNPDVATQGQYPAGYTLTGTIARRNDDIFSGITSVTIYIHTSKQSFLIPDFTSLNTASSYVKQ
jgi:uncharacterized repeat protein (TIGR02543 family)